MHSDTPETPLEGKMVPQASQNESPDPQNPLWCFNAVQVFLSRLVGQIAGGMFKIHFLKIRLIKS